MYETWRADVGYLVRRDDPTDVLYDVALQRASGSPLRSIAANFYLLDASGEVVRTIDCRTYSLEDELNTTFYVVEDGALWEVCISDRSSSRFVTEERVVDGLVASDADLRPGIERHLRKEQLREEARARAGEQRVAAIDGAHDSFGPDVDLAMEALRTRVRAYGDSLDTLLLKTLIAHARARRPGLAQLAIACRTAAFQLSPKPAAAASRPPGALGECYDALLAAADGQDEADAPRNSSAFRLAAAYVALAGRTG